MLFLSPSKDASYISIVSPQLNLVCFLITPQCNQHLLSTYCTQGMWAGYWGHAKMRKMRSKIGSSLQSEKAKDMFMIKKTFLLYTLVVTQTECKKVKVASLVLSHWHWDILNLTCGTETLIRSHLPLAYLYTPCIPEGLYYHRVNLQGKWPQGFSLCWTYSPVLLMGI